MQPISANEASGVHERRSNNWSAVGWTPNALAFAQGTIGFIAVQYWGMMVNEEVPEPYLDEVFHVPQTQKYCEGRYREWDDKITTPPGLYLLSNAWVALRNHAIGGGPDLCSTSNLRFVNCLIWSALFMTLWGIVRLKEAKRMQSTGRLESRLSAQVMTVGNITLFPLIAFFSGLFYTDLASLLAVLMTMYFSMATDQEKGYGLIRGFGTVALGLFALLVRQTNVFWVVVYLGGLEAVQAVKKIEPPHGEEPTDKTIWGKSLQFLHGASVGDIHDPSLTQAWVEDWIGTAISLTVAAICNPLRVMAAVWPYLIILASFVSFAAWNGGVVLGDKSNHVAMPHLPQMLYIWPFFAFFSWPLFIPWLVGVLDQIIAASQAGHVGFATSKATLILYGLYLTATVVFSLAIVHWNTYVHPFTLADNRHYMFYVFRYTINNGRTLRYWLVAAYTTCRWACWGVLSAPNVDVEDGVGAASSPQNGTLMRNLADRPSSGQEQQSTEGEKGEDNTVKTQPDQGMTTSEAIIFLLATTLALVPAPLVEPRYFIMPWVMWRLSIPLSQPPYSRARTRVLRPLWDVLNNSSMVMLLEMSWNVVVNFVTMWVFLRKPFLWVTETGEPQEGVQRFMW